MSRRCTPGRPEEGLIGLTPEHTRAIILTDDVEAGVGKDDGAKDVTWGFVNVPLISTVACQGWPMGETKLLIVNRESQNKLV
jgi:hypothetical protein